MPESPEEHEIAQHVSQAAAVYGARLEVLKQRFDLINRSKGDAGKFSPARGRLSDFGSVITGRPGFFNEMSALVTKDKLLVAQIEREFSFIRSRIAQAHGKVRKALATGRAPAPVNLAGSEFESGKLDAFLADMLAFLNAAIAELDTIKQRIEKEERMLRATAGAREGNFELFKRAWQREVDENAKLIALYDRFINRHRRGGIWLRRDWKGLALTALGAVWASGPTSIGTTSSWGMSLLIGATFASAGLFRWLVDIERVDVAMVEQERKTLDALAIRGLHPGTAPWRVRVRQFFGIKS